MYYCNGLVWFGFLSIYVDLAIFQPYLDLEAGDNQSLKIRVARPGIEPRSSVRKALKGTCKKVRHKALVGKALKCTCKKVRQVAKRHLM